MKTTETKATITYVFGFELCSTLHICSRMSKISVAVVVVIIITQYQQTHTLIDLRALQSNCRSDITTRSLYQSPDHFVDYRAKNETSIILHSLLLSLKEISFDIQESQYNTAHHSYSLLHKTSKKILLQNGNRFYSLTVHNLCESSSQRLGSCHISFLKLKHE